MEKQQFREALTEYQHVASLFPSDDKAQYELALLHLKIGKADDLSLAHQALLKVVRLNPSRFDAHVHLGRLYLISEQPAKARLHAYTILALQPTNADGHLIRGQSLIREINVQAGMAELHKAIEADPDRPDTYLELSEGVRRCAFTCGGYKARARNHSGRGHSAPSRSVYSSASRRHCSHAAPPC